MLRTWDLVITDLGAMQARRDEPSPTLAAVIVNAFGRHAVGIDRYGVPLHPHNGRDSLTDAYEELLDAAVYLKNEAIEHPPAPNDLRLRQVYDQTIGLAITVRGLIDERDAKPEGGATCPR
jgi:hypothetical protein